MKSVRFPLVRCNPCCEPGPVFQATLELAGARSRFLIRMKILILETTGKHS
jgi:hypothetical protein